MRTARALCVVVVGVGAIVSNAGSAAAQTADPNAYTVPEEQAADYPSELVDRPLLLPQGIEVDLTLSTNANDDVALFDFVQLGLGGRIGTGRLEVFGSIGLVPKQPDGADEDELRRITGGGAFEVAPNVALRGELTIWRPASDTIKIIDALGAAQVKRKLAPRVAVVATGGFNFINYLPNPEATDPLWEARVFASAQAQLQVAPSLAAYGTVLGSVPIAYNPDWLEPDNYFSVEGGGLLNVAPKVDAYGSVVVSDVAEESRRMTYFYVGALARL